MATAVIAGVYFVVWALIGLILWNLIDIPEIDETGTYYILTDEIEPETGDNVEAEFFVDIASNWHTDYYDDMPPESRLVQFFCIGAMPRQYTFARRAVGAWRSSWKSISTIDMRSIINLKQ